MTTEMKGPLTKAGKGFDAEIMETCTHLNIDNHLSRDLANRTEGMKDSNLTSNRIVNVNGAIAMKRAYTETPGVKKLAKGYKLLPKEVLSDVFGGNLLKSGFITFMSTLFIAAIVYAAAARFSISTLWATVIILLLGAALFTFLMHPVLSWALTASDSPIVINKRHRANLKKTRRLAAQLGETVVPVLTEDHVAAIEQVHVELKSAASSDMKKSEIARDTNYDRIAVLLLEDLNRDAVLFDLIKDRGLATMDEVEAALREIEADTIGPVQGGWL